MALAGLQHVCDWTAVAMELVTWKLAHPTNANINSDCPADCDEDYEKATRYNFSASEKAALVEVCDRNNKRFYAKKKLHFADYCIHKRHSISAESN